MKQRAYGALNVFALCLLLFAGYLNFYKKETDAGTPLYPKTDKVNISKNTVLITTMDPHLKTKAKSTNPE